MCKMEVALTTLSIFVCCLALTIIFISRRIWHRREQNLPPGPLGWPVIGIIPILSRAERQGKHAHTVMSELCHRYGNVFSFRLGNRLVVCLNSLQAIKEAFNNNDICGREATLLHSIPGCPGEGKFLLFYCFVVGLLYLFDLKHHQCRRLKQ